MKKRGEPWLGMTRQGGLWWGGVWVILFLLLLAGDARGDVYVYRGLGGVWSSGLGEACAFLERKGIKCRFGEEPKPNGKPIVLVGHSMGGGTAINYAMAMKVHTVILLDPVGSAFAISARTILVQSAGWNSQPPNGAIVVHCRDCSHTSLDDNEGIQYMIIREAVSAHAGYVAPAVEEKKTWRRRR
jgi:pimeloyl-ACP methyl ester carboxylesterase